MQSVITGLLLLFPLTDLIFTAENAQDNRCFDSVFCLFLPILAFLNVIFALTYFFFFVHFQAIKSYKTKKRECSISCSRMCLLLLTCWFLTFISFVILVPRLPPPSLFLSVSRIAYGRFFYDSFFLVSSTSPPHRSPYGTIYYRIFVLNLYRYKHKTANLSSIPRNINR